MGNLEVGHVHAELCGDRKNLGCRARAVRNRNPELDDITKFTETGGQVGACGSSPLQTFKEGIALSFADDRSHLGQPANHRIKCTNDGVLVFTTNVHPDSRSTRGDTSHVTKPAGGEPEDRHVLFALLGGQTHQRGGGEMWKVTDEGNHFIMTTRIQDDDLRTQITSHRRHCLERRITGVLVRCQHPGGTNEQIRIHSRQTGQFATRHGVPTDESRIVDLFDHVGLDTSHIGDDTRYL